MCHGNLIELQTFGTEINQNLKWTQLVCVPTIGSHHLKHNIKLIILIEYIRNMSQSYVCDDEWRESFFTRQELFRYSFFLSFFGFDRKKTE